MPKKVPFRVVANSGWEDEYPAKDLEVRKPPLVVAIEFVYYLHMQVQSPFIKGWRSPRYSVIKEACECVNICFLFSLKVLPLSSGACGAN